MQQFFAEPSWIEENRILMRGADVNHMKNVLRMKPGEDVRINDGAGKTYLCCISAYEEQTAVLDILKELDSDTELPSRIVLFQGLPKGDKMEWIVQKAVELGAAGIIPFAAGRSVVRLDEKKAEKKTARWQAIARSAAEQCGRAVIPEVSRPVSFAEALKQASELDVILIPYELERGMEETAEIIERIKGDGAAFFTIGDLSYLNKGGRIGGLVKLAAVGLGLKPVILFQEGNISLGTITRSRKKSLTELARQAAAFLKKKAQDLDGYYLQVGYGLSLEDGEEVRKAFREALEANGFRNVPEPELVQIGTMVGAHNGPYLMGIAFLKKYAE